MTKLKGKKMAKAAVVETRVPVLERGIALLALIAASAEGYLMLTQEEGAEIVASGDAVADTSIVDGDTVAVRLTDAGKAKLAPKAPVKSAFAIDDAVPLPTASRRGGRASGYPFEALEVGQSFHVAPGEGETAEEVVTRLQSSVSGARARFAVGTGEFETVTVKTYVKSPTGKGFAKDADGKRIVESQTTEQREVMENTRDFKVAEVGATDPRGPGARVWRTA